MYSARLTPLQRKLLCCLAGLEPPWTLTGGGALVGFYAGHRKTRDLDLFWSGLSSLQEVHRLVENRLQEEGLSFSIVQKTPSFVRIRVIDEVESIVIDLVADVVPRVEEPRLLEIEGRSIQVDSPHEILVNKLGALLGRSELRDLIDIKILLEMGGDLNLALKDIEKKDSSF